MKKKYQNDKLSKVSFKDKELYCLNFSTYLDSLFEPFGHDNRDFEKLNEGDFFLDEAINYDYDANGEETNDVMVCEKISNKEIYRYLLSEKDSIEKLYIRLKELGK